MKTAIKKFLPMLVFFTTASFLIIFFPLPKLKKKAEIGPDYSWR